MAKAQRSSSLLFRSSYDLDRLRGFSDCVFAVSITFVVATFRLPPDRQLNDVFLAHYLADRWPTYVGFFAGFVVVGYYWLSHHRLFELVVRADGRLVALNFGVLFFVVLLPFPTQMLGLYHTVPAAYIGFNATACLLGLVNLWMWAYAVGNRRMVAPFLDQRALTIYRLRAAWLPLVFGISGALSFLATEGSVAWLAVASWALLPLGRPLIHLVVGPVPFAELDAEASEVDDVVADELATAEVTAVAAAIDAPAAYSNPVRSDELGMLQRMFRSTSSMGRLISFSDNVYAFAITLLGAHFVLPPPTTSSTGDDLTRSLRELGSPGFVAFVISFLVIAMFWTVHHRIFLLVERQNGTLRVLNLVHLMAIALLPFSTDLLSTFADDALPFMLYAVTAGLASTTSAVIVTYLAHAHDLLDPNLPRAQVARWRTLSWVAPVCFLISIPLCFVAIWLAWFVWFVPLLASGYFHRRVRAV